MRIVINIDAIREKGKRLRIRTRYDLNAKDRAQHVTVQNAVLSLYEDLTKAIRKGVDDSITDFIDEGERV